MGCSKYSSDGENARYSDTCNDCETPYEFCPKSGFQRDYFGDSDRESQHNDDIDD